MALLEPVAEALGNSRSPEAFETLKNLAQSQWLTVGTKAKLHCDEFSQKCKNGSIASHRRQSFEIKSSCKRY